LIFSNSYLAKPASFLADAGTKKNKRRCAVELFAVTHHGPEFGRNLAQGLAKYNCSPSTATAAHSGLLTVEVDLAGLEWSLMMKSFAMDPKWIRKVGY
jgi:hypothetical protein